MRPGTRREGTRAVLLGFALALLATAALATALVSPAAGTSTPGIDASLAATRIGGGASASGGSTVLVLNGSPVASETTVFIDPATGELVLRDPTKTDPPGAPCTPAAGTPALEVRCPAGFIGAIVGNLNGGGDSFAAARSLRVLIGATVSGSSRPLRGGPGADSITGGAVGDSLFGGGGADRLVGGRNPDLLNGGPGADRLIGGLGGDGLFGAAGNDLLNGGSGRDFCNGGAGRDGFHSCALSK